MFITDNTITNFLFKFNENLSKPKNHLNFPVLKKNYLLASSLNFKIKKSKQKKELITFETAIHDYPKDKLDEFLAILKCNGNERHALKKKRNKQKSLKNLNCYIA